MDRQTDRLAEGSGQADRQESWPALTGTDGQVERMNTR